MSGTGNNTLKLEALPMRLVLVGGVLLAVCVAAGFADKAEFFRSYLVAYLFWISITLGCLALLMVQHLTGGQWALVIRRILEAGSRTLPLMAIAALPLLAGMKSLYSWSSPPGQNDPIIVAKHLYLNPQFFVVRMIIYFCIWFALSYQLNKGSQLEDAEGAGLPLLMRMEALSGVGLVLYGFTITFAGIDWIMSLEPRWYSTIYGLLFMVGQALAAMAFSIAVLIWLSDREPLSRSVQPAHFQDLGSFLLVFVMLWAYMEFSQFLIIWGGNLTDEIPWYLRRMQGTWGHIGLLLVVLNFALPFFLLLFRHVKRRMRSLLIVTGLVLVMRLVDMYWMVLPAFGGGNVHLTWMNVVLPFGLGGIWFAYFIWQLQQQPILPIHDPRMEGVAQHAAGHGG
jgi:hypothetical protein